MTKRILTFAISSAFGLGMAIAAPQDAAPQSAPPAQDQAAPPPPDQAGAPQDMQSGRPGMNPDAQVQMMSRRLNLTDAQANQIRPILADRISQMQALRADTSLAPADKRGKMRSILQDTDSRIRPILNDTQRAQYEKMEQRQMDRMRQRMQQRNGGGDGSDTTNQ